MMVKYTIDGSPINVAYGYDDATGVFLTVYDNRLKFNADESAELNTAFSNCKLPGVESGEGAYLQLYTGATGCGIKTSWAVMSEYLKRYGVPRDHITELLKEHLKHPAK
ncbi:hypothetical protein HA402_013180 [Bradysia odoriphaga]|nr:hypothetical protein HA402_013180 [Bradysia odoriphaga]